MGKAFYYKPAKAKNAEFNMKGASPEERIGFQESDAAEWKNILKLGAARVLSNEEANHVKKHLAHRVVSSRMITA